MRQQLFTMNYLPPPPSGLPVWYLRASNKNENALIALNDTCVCCCVHEVTYSIVNFIKQRQTLNVFNRRRRLNLQLELRVLQLAQQTVHFRTGFHWQNIVHHLHLHNHHITCTPGHVPQRPTEDHLQQCYSCFLKIRRPSCCPINRVGYTVQTSVHCQNYPAGTQMFSKCFHNVYDCVWNRFSMSVYRTSSSS